MYQNPITKLRYHSGGVEQNPILIYTIEFMLLCVVRRALSDRNFKQNWPEDNIKNRLLSSLLCSLQVGVTCYWCVHAKREAVLHAKMARLSHTVIAKMQTGRICEVHVIRSS